jgi:hypothetical protein
MDDGGELLLDRLRRQWPHAYKVLATDPFVFLRWDEILVLFERELAKGKSVARAAAADPRLRRMRKVQLDTFKKAAATDLKLQRNVTPTFLGPLVGAEVRDIVDWDDLTPAASPMPLVIAPDDLLRPRFVLSAPDFVCHRRKCTGRFARELTETLTSAGREVWLAPRDARTSDQWNDDCALHVQDCGEFILCLSAQTHFSKRAIGEVQLAVELGKRITVIELSADAQPDRIDLALRTYHHIEWYVNPSAGMSALLASLNGDRI